MRLRDLDGQFVHYESHVDTWSEVVGDPMTWKSGDPTAERTGPRGHRIKVETIAHAQGVRFDCPSCKSRHAIEVTFADRGVDAAHGSHDKDGRPTRWAVSGTSLDDLTLSPSVDCTRGVGCSFHGWVTNGAAQ